MAFEKEREKEEKAARKQEEASDCARDFTKIRQELRCNDRQRKRTQVILCHPSECALIEGERRRKNGLRDGLVISLGARTFSGSNRTHDLRSLFSDSDGSVEEEVLSPCPISIAFTELGGRRNRCQVQKSQATTGEGWALRCRVRHTSDHRSWRRRSERKKRRKSKKNANES